MSRMSDQDARKMRERRTLEEAESDLNQARHILSGGGSYQPDEWSLLVMLVGEADLTFQEARRKDPTLEWPLLEAAVQDLRETTAGFTNLDFLRSTRAARRRYPKLFK